VKLVILPESGVAPVVEAIRRARKSIDLTIFRFDQAPIEQALGAAVQRGVLVRALIAHTNRGGERRLRKLETRLLAAGVVLARSADDLVRYHGKMMIVDGRTLFLMLFNLTRLDAGSRSFGVMTGERALVAAATRLFEADIARQPYESNGGPLVVSPENAREQLARFVGSAKRTLWIYDPKVSDGAMVRLLEQRRRQGVEVRILGSVGRRARSLESAPLRTPRLHARMILRDGRAAFLGSQSLRGLELDSRREIGVIVKNRNIVRGLRETFAEDWERMHTPNGKDAAESAA